MNQWAEPGTCLPSLFIVTSSSVDVLYQTRHIKVKMSSQCKKESKEARQLTVDLGRQTSTFPGTNNLHTCQLSTLLYRLLFFTVCFDKNSSLELSTDGKIRSCGYPGPDRFFGTRIASAACNDAFCCSNFKIMTVGCLWLVALTELLSARILTSTPPNQSGNLAYKR
jgi:hypothetical protein